MCNLNFGLLTLNHKTLLGRRTSGALWLLITCLWSHSLQSATLPAGFTEQVIGSGWNEAVGILFEDNGRMYVWERGGRVWIVENGVKMAYPLIDISDEVGGWRDFGLLGFALDPNFRSNGYIYLLYVVDHHHLVNAGTMNYNPSVNEYFRATIGRITRYTAKAADAFKSVDNTTRRVLVGESIDKGFPILYESHGVGSLVFGTDGTLLASCGDGASYSSVDVGNAAETYYSAALAEGIIKPKENVGAYRAQLVDSLSGKVLRIDPATGDGLPSNPFYDAANPRSARSRVWALGLRNPCRMTLKAGTGSHNRADGNPGVLFIGDVGWDTWEELNVATGPGRNFGWPAFEGLETRSEYFNSNVANRDAPNPLYGSGGCTRQYFYFRDLIKQDSLNPPSFPNPCNTSVQVPNTLLRFVHTRPAIDWKHSTGPSRTGTYDANGNATVINIGASGSPVSGPQFPGNCSIGGLWYTNTDFPAQYRNTYFHVDFGAHWIRSFSFDQNSKPTSVQDFLSNGTEIVALGTDPLAGGIYYITWNSDLRKISYVPSGNQPPTAVASVNKNYGPSPLTVQFTGSGSTDPEGRALTYSWNFGDGSALSTQANPSHTFNASPGVPTKYTVSLTVRDPSNATSVATLIISANNTAPSVTITNPIRGTRYGMTGETLTKLRATVTDVEQRDDQLLYQWQTVLHHNNHEHTEPLDTNHATTTLISPVGCDGNLYYYRILLTVTDSAGLSATNEVDLYPACSNAPPVASFTAAPTNGNGPLVVSFDAGETRDPDGDPLVYNWNFGDSTTAIGVTPTHTFSAPGNYTVSLTATDTFGLAGSATARIHVNAPPAISNIGMRSVNEDTSTGPINFVIGDAETPAANLTLSATSSNPTLVPVSNIVFGGSGSNRTVTISPASNLSGSSTIGITVNDGSLTANSSFGLLVNSVNDAPTITAVSDQTMVRDTRSAPIGFTIGDVESAAITLTVGGTSSNPSLIPNNGIVFSGSGSQRTFTLLPATNQTGTATITISVSDGSAVTDGQFLLTVVSPAPRFGLKINFQPASAPVPGGYLVDSGLVYADRGNGRSYGWDVDNSASARDRNSPLSPDQRYDTLNWLQQSGSSRIWELGLSNGTYTVMVVAGDPSAFDSIYKINVEGVLTVDGTPSSSARWVSGTKTVSVNDGRLTVSNAAGSISNKLCFIDIVGGPVSSGAELPCPLTLLNRDTNGWVELRFDGQAGRNYVLESSANLLRWTPVTLFQNFMGTVQYMDKNVVTNAQRFYRAFRAP